MEEEWEAFIAEAKARGYGSNSSSGEDEPLTIIPAGSSKGPKATGQYPVAGSTVAGPDDAEEAVRSAGLGMSSLSISATFETAGKRQKTIDTSTPVTVMVPVMTPTLFNMLSPPRQELFFNELAVAGSVGLYVPKQYTASVTSTTEPPANAKKLPSSMFLSPSSKFSIQPLSVDDGKSHVCLSFGHLFCLCAAMPFTAGDSSQWAMHVERSNDGRLLFKEVNVTAFSDRATSFLSLYLPSLHELIGAPTDCTVTLNNITVTAPMHPVALLIPGSPFAESLLAVTAMMSPSRLVSVGRLDAMTGSVHQVQSVTLDISKAAAVHCLAYLFERLLALPAGDYILVHRRGADNVIVTRERESESEIIFDYASADPLITLDQLNSMN